MAIFPINTSPSALKELIYNNINKLSRQATYSDPQVSLTPTKKFPYMAAGIVVTIIANAILGYCAAVFAPKPPMPEINFDKIESGISDITNKMLNQIQQPQESE